MAEKDRFTISRERAASSVRSKITGFDFADTSRANIATAKMLGEVASTIAEKSDQQNEQFDRLLKVLNFLPKDFVERKKQQKELLSFVPFISLFLSFPFFTLFRQETNRK